MDDLFTICLFLLPVFVPFITGRIAKARRRKYWSWFLAGFFCPLPALVILVCLPTKIKITRRVVRPVENEELFDHLFLDKSLEKPAMRA